MKKTLYERMSNHYSVYFDYIIKNIDVESMESMDLKGNLSNLEVDQVRFYHLALFKHSGKKIYEIHENISDMLMHTDISISLSLFKAPVLEFLLILPPNLIKLKQVNGSAISFTECYILFKENSNMTKHICFLFCNQDMNFLELEITLPEYTNKTVKDLLNNVDINLDPKYDNSDFSSYLNFLCNCIIYITSSNSDLRVQKEKDSLENKLERTKSPIKRKKIEKKLREQSRLSRYIIGSNIQVSPEERNLYNKLREGIHSGRYSCRFQVGGHWRSQWYGPKDKRVQKAKWIRPYFKGPELGEIIRSVGIIKK